MIKTHSAPRFLLRENLGKLAKELRFLGYNAALYRNISLANAQRIAYKDKRLLLTRSHSEYRDSKMVKSLLIHNDNYLNQLREIKYLLKFEEAYTFSICSKCNKKLYEIDKNKIISLVPEYIWNTHSEFRICCHCGALYWKGDHYDSIKKRLISIFEGG